METIPDSSPSGLLQIKFNQIRAQIKKYIDLQNHKIANFPKWKSEKTTQNKFRHQRFQTLALSETKYKTTMNNIFKNKRLDQKWTGKNRLLNIARFEIEANRASKSEGKEHHI